MEGQELTLESLAAQLKIQQENLAQLQLENATLKGQFVEITKKPELPKIPEEPITYKKKNYKWKVAAFTLPGKETKTITAEEASLDEETIAAVLKIEGQGILVEQA